MTGEKSVTFYEGFMKKYFTILVVLFLTSCAAFNYQIYSDYDKFNDAKLDSMLNNYVSCESDLLTKRSVQFNFAHTKQKEKDFYNIVIYYEGSDWFFIRSGESLVMLIDGERKKFSGNGSQGHRTVISGDAVMESAYFNADKEFIKEISEAKNVEFQIRGKYGLDCKLTETNLTRIREFYKTYIE
jgi:hypothetical protein